MAWVRTWLFQFEGGLLCQDHCALSREAGTRNLPHTERVRHGLENVVLDETPDSGFRRRFADETPAAPTRCTHSNASNTGRSDPSAQHHHADRRTPLP